MPKGVEHYLAVPSIEHHTTAFLSIMPKGVEHIWGAGWLRWGFSRIAFLSIMPKGVEHLEKMANALEGRRVANRVSIMPKGVEHQYAYFALMSPVGCVSIYYAERR